MKPRLRQLPGGIWECASRDGSWRGVSPQQAYRGWQILSELTNPRLVKTNYGQAIPSRETWPPAMNLLEPTLVGMRMTYEVGT